MQKNIKINNVDFTAWTPPVGYIVTPRYVRGGNNMVMQNGMEYRDEIDHKSDVEVPFLPLTDAQINTLMTNLNSGMTCYVFFYDPDEGEYRTMTAYRSVKGRKFRGKGADGNYYWTGITVMFEEK